jgi:hypothetical protein
MKKKELKVKNSDIEKFHKACKSIIEVMAMQNRCDDKFIVCDPFVSSGVQVHRGLEKMAEYFGIKNLCYIEKPYGTGYKGEKYFIYDNVRYFQIV